MDLKREYPSLMRHHNRPEPLARIRPKSDVVVWNDSDTVCIHHLTRREAELVYEACLNSRALYGMTYVLGTMLGFDQTEDEA